MFGGLAKLAGIGLSAVGAIGATSLSTSTQALNALAMPLNATAKLVAQGGTSAMETTASGIAQAGGMTVAGTKGVFDTLVMNEAKATLKQVMQEASPSSWMS